MTTTNRSRGWATADHRRNVALEAIRDALAPGEAVAEALGALKSIAASLEALATPPEPDTYPVGLPMPPDDPHREEHARQLRDATLQEARSRINQGVAITLGGMASAPTRNAVVDAVMKELYPDG